MDLTLAIFSWTDLLWIGAVAVGVGYLIGCAITTFTLTRSYAATLDAIDPGEPDYTIPAYARIAPARKPRAKAKKETK